MAHDDYRPRDHDHLVEPFLGPFAAESAPGSPASRRHPSARPALILLALLALAAFGAWVVRRASPGGGGASESAPLTPATEPSASEAPAGRTAPAAPGRELARDAPGGGAVAGSHRVVDDANDAPIAGLVVVEQREGVERSATSDEEGRFALAMEAGTSRFEARLADGAEVPLAERSFVVRANAPGLELRARIGPRYLVEVVGPPEARAASYVAHLVERVSLPSIGERDLDRAKPRPLERGEPCRVRFAKPPDASASGLRLVLRDASGEWSGAAVPPTLVGEPAEIVRVEVARGGVLTGRLVETDGRPIVGATAHLARAGAETWPRIESNWDVVRTDAEGRFRFERLAPGDCHLLLAPPWRPMLVRRLAVAEGVQDLGTMEVPGGGDEGVVAGTIRSVAGRGGIGAILQLESMDGTGWARSTIVGRPTPLMALFYGGRADQEAGEETEVAFRLDHVPAGRYRLIVVPWDGRRYEPTELELVAPTEEVVVWREDSSADVGFGFVVVDGGTGETLPEFQARFHTRRWGKERSFAQRSGEVLGRVAPDGDLSFALFAPGYAPSYGDASLLAQVEGDPRFVTVALARGWGAEFTVRDGRDPRRDHHRAASALSIPAPGEVPLAGVRVLADGHAVAVTDADGRARVVLAAAPGRIAFERPGWITTPTTTFADGRVLLDCPSPKVWMVPAEPR